MRWASPRRSESQRARFWRVFIAGTQISIGLALIVNMNVTGSLATHLVVMLCTVAVGVATTLFITARFKPRHPPDHTNRCPKCGYSLRGLSDTSFCPECGEVYSPEVLRLAWAAKLGVEPPANIPSNATPQRTPSMNPPSDRPTN